MKDKVKSRKFVVTLGSVAGILLCDGFGVDLDAGSVAAIVTMALGYVGVQGWQDTKGQK